MALSFRGIDLKVSRRYLIYSSQNWLLHFRTLDELKNSSTEAQIQISSLTENLTQAKVRKT